MLFYVYAYSSIIDIISIINRTLGNNQEVTYNFTHNCSCLVPIELKV